MMENDPLQTVLHEWKAPEPTAAFDAQVRSAYRAAFKRSLWQAFWAARISVPVPAVAALVVIVFALFLQFRSVPAPVSPAADRGYVTRLDATGFQPLPNGAARVVAVGGIQQ